MSKYTPEAAVLMYITRCSIVESAVEHLKEKRVPYDSLIVAEEQMRLKTMAKIPADEIENSDPEPRFEPFFLACMLKVGDPDKDLENRAMEFYKYKREYFANKPIKLPPRATLLVQYIIWYERESRRLKSGQQPKEFLP